MNQLTIPNSKPFLSEEDLQAVKEVFFSGLIAEGDDITAFEDEFSRAMGYETGSSVAVSSGFAALFLSLAALGVNQGDEVIIPCVSSCAAIRNAVSAIGATPVFCDTNIDDFNLLVENVKRLISKKVKAIISPHHLGIPSDILGLRRTGTPIIQDSAQALGLRHDDKPIALLGDISIFSFYATKVITSIDGGMISSEDMAVIDRARDLRYYAGKYDFKLRYNLKMQNIGAALGRMQLKRLPVFLQRRQKIAREYENALREIGITDDYFLYKNSQNSIFFRFGLCLPSDIQTKIIGYLLEKGIPAGSDMMFLTPEKEKYPNALRMCGEVVTLPTYPALNEDEVALIIKELIISLKNFFPKLSRHIENYQGTVR